MDSPISRALPEGVEVLSQTPPGLTAILTPQALGFVAALEREFGSHRRELLARRKDRQAEINSGQWPTFLPATEQIRAGSWQVAPVPADLQKRRVEITGATDRKMMINALNSGASTFMADFEDANSPTWLNMLHGQSNLCDAIQGTIRFTGPDGRHYRLGEQVATLLVRPRGWHLDEKHVTVDGRPVSASLFDFGLYFFHNARQLVDKGTGPYFYLPKLESRLEARLWNDVFALAQDEIGLPRGTIKATVLIETILAAFEMDEILYELRDHAAGLNAGRWDYIFSAIKTFRRRPDVLFPDRAQITMTVPFMRAFTELLVKTCHRRGAHAIGGMTACVPSRRDPEVNEKALAQVRQDKVREAGDGFDGTWVAHPDLVPVAMKEFDRTLGDRPHQKERLREDVQVAAADLLDFHVPDGHITEGGLIQNIDVAVQYLESWLRGTGAVAINNLMENTATAEISRAQIWQWFHHPGATLADGRALTPALYDSLLPVARQRVEAAAGHERFVGGHYALAEAILHKLAGTDRFVEFLTLTACQYLD